MNRSGHALDLLKRLDDLLGRPLARRLGGRRRPIPTAPRDVLVIRLWGLGNLVHLAPLLASQGDRRTRLLTLERNRAFVERHLPGVEVLSVPHPLRVAFAAVLARRLLALRRDPPDLIVDVEPFLRLPNLLVRGVTGAPAVGQDTPGQGRGPLLDRAIAYDPTRHVAHTYAALFAAAGLAPVVAPAGSGLHVPHDARAAVVRRLRGRGVPVGAGPLVLLHPGSGDHFPGRRWPPDRFGELARRLAAAGAVVVVGGTPAEGRLADEVVLASAGAARSVVGLVDGAALSDLVACADLVVTNDTGPLHLADALGRSVVGLFGPNTPHRYGPRGPHGRALFADLPCSPCLDDRSMKRSPCRDYACMHALDVDSVERACRSLLAPRPAAVPGEELRVAVDR